MDRDEEEDAYFREREEGKEGGGIMRLLRWSTMCDDMSNTE